MCQNMILYLTDMMSWQDLGSLLKVWLLEGYCTSKTLQLKRSSWSFLGTSKICQCMYLPSLKLTAKCPSTLIFVGFHDISFFEGFNQFFSRVNSRTLVSGSFFVSTPFDSFEFVKSENAWTWQKTGPPKNPWQNGTNSFDARESTHDNPKEKKRHVFVGRL